jgi:hypothetical protein
MGDGGYRYPALRDAAEKCRTPVGLFYNNSVATALLQRLNPTLSGGTVNEKNIRSIQPALQTDL